MNITVKIDEVSLATVVDQITTYNEEGVYPNTEVRTVGHLVAEMIMDRLVSEDHERWYELRQAVIAIKREVIRDKVLPVIEQAVAEPIQKTNSYGERVGEPVTLREVIVDEAQKLLNKRADTYGNGQTVLQKIVAEEVQKAFAAEIKDAVTKARASVADDIGKQVAAAVTSAMKGR